MPDISDLVDPSGNPLGDKKQTPPSETNIDYKERYLRAVADYQNLKRQTEAERAAIFTMAVASVLESIIPTLDMIQQAEVWVKDPGLAMVRQQFMQTLKDLGLTEMDLVGKPFDPHYAEAIESITGDVDGVVQEVKRSGYLIGDKVIRVAQVVVSSCQKVS